MRKNDEIDNLISVIEDFWQKKQNGECFNKNEAISIANNIIDLLDRGEISVVEKDVNGSWKPLILTYSPGLLSNSTVGVLFFAEFNLITAVSNE